MKLRYEKDDDVLMIWFSKDPVDYAKKQKDIIVHFSKDNKPVLYEILNASHFLREVSLVLPSSVRQSVFT